MTLMDAKSRPRIACIGECMIELRELVNGTLQKGYGGDTLNTAVYLARLGMSVEYVTALGDDSWSSEMLAAWEAEGVGTALVRRLPGRLPGLYIIQTDAGGERRLSHWRDSAAARQVFAQLDPTALDRFDLLYLSGITLSILDDSGRSAMFTALDRARERGTAVAFDTNFRASGWPETGSAQALYERMFDVANVVIASAEDLALLYGSEQTLLRHAATTEIVLRHAHPASRVYHQKRMHDVVAEPITNVVDTTAAGDSFAAAYIAGRLQGVSPEQAARAGHLLAGKVVTYPGAIMPLHTMPNMNIT